MQLLQAGAQQMVVLELDSDLLRQGAQESGFSCTVLDTARFSVLELSLPESAGPILLFDAADPSSTGWFSRCQFYVDARSGAVLQTPFIVANRLDHTGRPSSRAITVQVLKELPSHFRLPGRQAVSEKLLYGVLFGFLNALLNSGVGICGQGVVRPLAGRLDAPPAR
ncbi:MAG: hypothetical protein HZB13_05230 [Acidobacteria bacterium]|nr:hypothetical protein [Acidobacteriota bacterium]